MFIKIRTNMHSKRRSTSKISSSLTCIQICQMHSRLSSSLTCSQIRQMHSRHVSIRQYRHSKHVNISKQVSICMTLVKTKASTCECDDDNHRAGKIYKLYMYMCMCHPCQFPVRCDNKRCLVLYTHVHVEGTCKENLKLN